jgi:Fuc2NAc and GlcNAc transferase
VATVGFVDDHRPLPFSARLLVHLGAATWAVASLYMIAVLALSASRDNPVALWVWLILGGAFFADATVTLLRRLLRGERVHQAHRCHAYQWLARRWGSHRKVTVAMLAVNVVWLLPWAVLVRTFPRHAAVSVVAALAPLALLVAVLGAGRTEDSRPQ